ncbi:hypothetical protein K6T82_10530 [Flavobacterium sp. 17A]|uniref:Uncharacterized protein n=1 Tax=Flavobacterium potami TaxID=2872310 RepID=A0A9X1HAM7_9FLAO|nr:hypothetical protein [Flavobacterium potami]MBZ4035205.1 hypothetical protein [Flavobacterium potami]
MIISFDLDDTLIAKNKFGLEKRNLFQKLFGLECVREGTIDLFKELRAQKHKIYIYTTSYRTTFRIWLMFYSYGVSVNCIINQQKHLKKIKKLDFNCSKFPPMFKIDIHIDDSQGVKMEGEKYGFKTIIISETDKNWTQTILRSI